MLLGIPRTTAIIIVVVIAALASVAIWQWRSAASGGPSAGDRDAVAKVVAEYGDVAVNYNASNYQGQLDKAQKLMAGDLLDYYKRCTVPGIQSAFKSDNTSAITSKTDKVFVGDVDGKFATAVASVDVTVKSSKGQVEQPKTLMRLSLVKQDGKWLVSQQFASGLDKMQQDCGQGGVPGATNPSPSPSSSEKPKN